MEMYGEIGDCAIRELRIIALSSRMYALNLRLEKQLGSPQIRPFKSCHQVGQEALLEANH